MNKLTIAYHPKKNKSDHARKKVKVRKDKAMRKPRMPLPELQSTAYTPARLIKFVFSATATTADTCGTSTRMKTITPTSTIVMKELIMPKSA